MPKTKAFNDLMRSVKQEYLGQTVPAKYKEKYGKRYDIKEVTSLAYAIAKTKGMRT